MVKQYTPRRAGLKRWLEGAPPYILDVLDSKGPGERYTVVFGADFMPRRGTYAESRVAFLGMDDSPTGAHGVSMWGEFGAYECAMYRYRCKHHRVRWLDLPENIRAHVIARAESES